ncbi:lamin tail domain-containing protein [Haloferula sp.]|uniref:lamin tail domain-containing protein n=1 Tax=Haloferula sp. TaxID=2497595 RepID=UPI0032A0BD6D
MQIQPKSLIQRLACSLAALLLVGSATAAPIDLSAGSPAQTTLYNGASNYSASRAIDGVANFTHTAADDPDPRWQVLLSDAKTFQEITLLNRPGTGSWRNRLRDITVQIVNFSGDVEADFHGGTITYTSALLNPGNILESPDSITVNVGGASGNMIRVIRTPDGTSSDGVLSLDEVLADGTERIISFTTPTPFITPGDPITLEWEVSTGVTALAIDNGVGNVLPNTSAGIGSILVATGPSVTSPYEITATDAGGSSTSSTTITVTDKPLIYSFAADNGYSNSGANVNLSWNVGGNATTLTLNGADVIGSAGTTVAPTVDSSYELIATNANGSVTRTVFVKIIEPGVPVINEFLASNSDGLLDIDGNSSDWIELYNPGAIPAPLLNFSLTDDELDLTKWSFPDITMAPGSYLVIHASGVSKVNPASELHTNFTLSANGEFLALVKPDGTTISSGYDPNFPAQRTDVSYGLEQGSNVDGFFQTPTPGAPNGSSVLGFVSDTTFSFDRGIYSSPIAVAITSLTPGAEIRYTLDGTKPTPITGMVYSAGSPINISQTTVLRAAAYLDQYEPTNVDTHTYIFKADVIAGPNMDTGITQDPTYGPQMDAALSAIPSVSLNFSGDLNYEEQEVSIEFINFEAGDTQADAGMERFGGYVTNFDKRSARIAFRSEYGPGKLNFDLFENHDWPSYQPAKKYDAIELRAGNHDMWQRGAYLSNRFADDALLDMGQIAPHGRFVHVYMNGEYWGQYHLRERWSASMFSEYFGGSKDDYEAINANNSGSQFQTGEAFDGDGTQWEETQTLLDGATPYTSARSHLDIINVIDFTLLWTNGNSESEFRAAGSVPRGVPFKFFLKDADGYLRNPASNHNVDHNGPLSAMTKLALEGDPDYQMLLADRIHKHFFNDGALTVDENIERLQDRVNETQLSILTESARWISMDSDLNPARWTSYQDNLITNHFPSLNPSMVTKFKTAGMYPDTDAPVFSEHGGIVLPASGPSISVTNSDYKVYYIFGPGDTDPDPYLHSLDPRLPGGAINPAAAMISFDGSGGTPTTFVASGDDWSYLDNGSDQGTAWRDTAFVENGDWESGPSQLGYGGDGEITLVDYIDTDAGSPGTQKNITTYFRKSDINIPDTSVFDDFTINFWYDDAIAIYVNGVEVERLGISANAPYTETSTLTVDDNAFGTIQVPISYFNNGNNTIAAEIHQRSNTSSDISFNLTLAGNVPGGGDPGLTSDPVTITNSGWLLSRAYNTTTGEWSALNSAFFTPEPELADSSNLVISEFNYHPDNPLTPEELAISSDPDEFEFIELKNVTTVPLDLSGLSFIDGIEFDFANNNILPAGGRMVIVRNKDAFEERYSSQLGSITYGTDTLGESEYGGKLSNGGEQLVLVDAGGSIIHDFNYDDQAPWPTATDGPGFSLALISPALPIPDHNIATNWAASAQVGGYPGTSSPVGFAGVPDADEDLDGIAAIVEYALGSSDSVAGDSTISTGVQSFEVDGETDEYFTISFLRNQHTANAVTVDPQIGEDLDTWAGEPEIVLVSETDNLDGTSTVVYRSAVPIGERPSGREFIRIGVSQ